MLGAAGMASGDTAYLSPAGPFRAVVSVAMTSATAETKVLGDPANAQGFRTSGGALVTPADVVWTAFTTNDKTAPSATAPLVLNSRDFLTFQDITIYGGTNGSNSCVTAAAGSTNLTFTRCTFLSGCNANSPRAIGYTATVDTAATWTFDSCIFLSVTAINMSIPSSTVADYNLAFVFKNCLFLNGLPVTLTSSGANTFKGGGISIYNSTVVASGNFFTSVTLFSTTYPLSVYNCVLWGSGSTCFNAVTSGQIVEDYNVLMGFAVARTNTSTGTNSKVGSYAMMLEVGQHMFAGRQARPFGMPTVGSPLLGFGAQAGGPTTDIAGGPRPAGGASPNYAVGPFERGNSCGRETSVTHTGSNAIKATGPAYHDFQVPVSAASTTISVYDRFDATYAGTKPQIILLANPEIGVTTQTVTDTGSAGAWNQISLAAFTPSAAGIVTVRLQSNDTNGGGLCYFDSFAVA